MRRIVIAILVLGACLSLAGCAHSNQVAYAKPLPWRLPDPTKASGMKPPQQHVRRSSKPTKVSSVKMPSPPVEKGSKSDQGEFFETASASPEEAFASSVANTPKSQRFSPSSRNSRRG